MSAHTLAVEHQAMAGWTDETLIDVLLDYIENQSSLDAFDDYLTQRRDDERSEDNIDGALESDAFKVAKGLCNDTDPNANPEYVRACAEMVCDLTGLLMDYKEIVIKKLLEEA